MVTESNDWYSATASLIATVFGCSVVTFVAGFVIIWTCIRSQFAHQSTIDKLQTLDSPELVLIKAHTRVVRVLSLVGVALQAALIIRLTNAREGVNEPSASEYTFTLYRPVSNLCVYFLGFMTNTHPFFRLLFVFCLVQMIVNDTIAEVTISMVVNCLHNQSLRCGKSPSWLEVEDLEFMRTRELFGLFVNPWLVLEMSYLSMAIGVCTSRYSRRHLSLSRPRFNVRAALRHYFPVDIHGRQRRDIKKWNA